MLHACPRAACMQVARILSVEAVENSDKLWRCQVDVGDEQPRQIVAGLQQHIAADRMTGLLAVAVCNLKPAKLAGQLSEGMLLAASNADKSVVRTLEPPADAAPGTAVRYLCFPAMLLLAVLWDARDASMVDGFKWYWPPCLVPCLIQDSSKCWQLVLWGLSQCHCGHMVCQSRLQCCIASLAFGAWCRRGASSRLCA